MPAPEQPKKASTPGAETPGATANACGCSPAKTASGDDKSNPPTRREFVWSALRGAFLFVLGAATTLFVRSSQKERTVWQIDPYKCIACTNCANYCVLTPSAVKCVQHYAMCGYCRLCFGYFEVEPNALNTAAENQVCPVGAIKRKALEDPYYDYTIDEPVCIGCGKCVVGCVIFGNGSFALQVRHDRCVNCNECAIAVVCPVDAFVRVPASQPYILKTRERQTA